MFKATNNATVVASDSLFSHVVNENKELV